MCKVEKCLSVHKGVLFNHRPFRFTGRTRPFTATIGLIAVRRNKKEIKKESKQEKALKEKTQSSKMISFCESLSLLTHITI